MAELVSSTEGTGGGVAGFAFAGRVDIEASRRAIGPLVPTVPAPPIPANAAFPELGTPTFLTPSADFYRIDINLTVPQVRAEDAVLRSLPDDASRATLLAAPAEDGYRFDVVLQGSDETVFFRL